MQGEARLWLVRHAPVAGSADVIHDVDAPADVSDVAAIAALRAKLPPGAAAFSSPARRALQTAAALRLTANPDLSLREQDFGSWTGQRHDQLARAGGDEYREFWRSPAARAAPGGESFVDQIARVRERLATLPDGDVVLI